MRPHRCFVSRLLLLLAGMLLAAAAAAGEFVLNEERRERAAADLTPHLDILEDKEGDWDIEHVTGPFAHRFAASQARESLNYGLGSSAWWLRVTIRNSSRHNLERRLEVAYPHLHYVDLYVPHGEDFTRIGTGLMRPFAERPSEHRNFVFPLTFPAQSTTTLYLRVRTDAATDIPVRLWTPQAFERKSLEEYIGQAVYFGAVLSLALFNLLLFISLRDRTYFFYVLFALTSILSLLAYSGMGVQYLWPNSGHWIIISAMVSFALNGMTMLMFQRQLLATASTVPLLDRVARIFIGINAVQIFGFVWSFKVMLPVGIVIDSANMLLALVIAIACARRGQRSAGIFVIAFACLMVAALCTAARGFGMPGVPLFITAYGMQIGSAMEMLLFSLALADRFNQIRREKEATQLQLVENLKRSERMLEQRVAERTQALMHSNAELRSHERALKQAKDVAEEASRMKSAFLANMSHEIRTPMNAVIGMAWLALQSGLNGKQRDYMEKIHRAGSSLLRVIDDILDFSKIEAGKLVLEKSDFSLHEVLGNVRTVTAQRAAEKHLHYMVDIGADVPARLRGDPLRLGQVLINLVGNAVKFTEQGHVVLRCMLVRQDAHALVLRFDIEDSGIGMTSEQQARLFQAFTQADESITRKYGGTGLGLAISKRLVELMDGTITLESAPALGSTFSFTVRLQPAAPAATMAGSVPAHLHGWRVLVIDQDGAARAALCRHLAELGLHAEGLAETEVPAAALRDAASGGYDLVIADASHAATTGAQLATLREARGILPGPRLLLT
ncbi:MAG TPA: 7TM diverse intracellular signaling domain-containing protein, partial [Noviherbaspirillum sp.]